MTDDYLVADGTKRSCAHALPSALPLNVLRPLHGHVEILHPCSASSDASSWIVLCLLLSLVMACLLPGYSSSSCISAVPCGPALPLVQAFNPAVLCPL